MFKFACEIYKNECFENKKQILEKEKKEKYEKLKKENTDDNNELLLKTLENEKQLAFINYVNDIKNRILKKQKDIKEKENDIKKKKFFSNLGKNRINLSK